MNPAATKTIMTLLAALLAGIAYHPPWTWLVPFVPLLTLAAGTLTGGAHIPQPSSAADLTARAAKAVEAEK